MVPPSSTAFKTPYRRDSASARTDADWLSTTSFGATSVLKRSEDVAANSAPRWRRRPSSPNSIVSKFLPSAEKDEGITRRPPSPSRSPTAPPNNTAQDCYKEEDEEDVKIPCEFCSLAIPASKIIRHQTNCTRNMDSLYFNAKIPVAAEVAIRSVPEVVSTAMIDGGGKNEPVDNRSLVDDILSKKDDLGANPPVGGARRKITSSSSNPPAPSDNGSIVGKYLGMDDGVKGQQIKKKRRAPLPPSSFSHSTASEDADRLPKEEVLVGQLVTFDGCELVREAVDSRRQVRVREQDLDDDDEHAPWRQPLLEAEQRARREERGKRVKLQFPERELPRKRSPTTTNRRYEPHSIANGRLEPRVPVYTGARPKKPVAPPRARTSPAANNGRERDMLREMLSGLRKDPFDDDLEANDGKFFPCEFCGDPYPSEFIMRHQLSCDLNPSPVAAGEGFDYAAIRSRAEENMRLARAADEIKF